MEFRQLGRSGLQVPLLAMGTATFGGGNEFFKAWGSSDVAEALDKRHAAAQVAFVRRDACAYAEMFHADLEYQRPDGPIIDRESLMRDVRDQFRRLSLAETSFKRERLEIEDGWVTETVIQSAAGEISAFFGLVRRLWNLHRRGRYSWTDTGGTWQIARVQVLSEVVRFRWKFGRRKLQ